ncbi:hypothetical protein K1719_026631 [Acacia pycnantha]|nr:hypothetical protein K1719_026631 [Acacia pycnantha]
MESRHKTDYHSMLHFAQLFDDGDHEEELVLEVDEEIANQSVSEQHGDDHIEEDENEEHTRLGENLRNSTADAMWRAYRS